MNRSIKNILFDWGGVLVHLDREGCVHEFEKLGIDLQYNLSSTGNSTLSTLLEYEWGHISTATFRDQVRNIAQRPLEDNVIDAAWMSMLEGIPQHKKEMLKALHQRYRLYLLSNTNEMHWEQGKKFFTIDGMQAEDLFERIFLSYKMHLVKPNADIFQKVIDDSQICPEETLFIDDSPANCETAATLGFQTYCPPTNGDWSNLGETLCKQ